MTDPKEYAASVDRYNAAQKQRSDDEAFKQVRSDALEEAAKVVENYADGIWYDSTAAAIRALKEKA